MKTISIESENQILTKALIIQSMKSALLKHETKLMEVFKVLDECKKNNDDKLHDYFITMLDVANRETVEFLKDTPL